MGLEQQFFVAIGDVGPAAPSSGHETEPRGCGAPRGRHVLRHGLPHERRHRPPVPSRQRLELALELRIDEEGRTFHMMYANIQTAWPGAEPGCGWMIESLFGRNENCRCSRAA